MTSYRGFTLQQVTLVIHVILPSFVFTVDRTGELLNDLRLTHWDEWGSNATCPESLFITSLKVRMGANSINGIQIMCSDEVSSRNKASRSASLGRPKGDWTLSKKCKAGFAIGISSEYSPSISASPGSSIQNLTIFCSDESPNFRDGGASKLNIEAKPSKEQIQFCDPGDALVGLKVDIDSIITVAKGDTSSVKNIGIQCRPVSNPANHYDIEFTWVKRYGMQCNDSQLLPTTSSAQPASSKNSSEKVLVACAYKSWTGIGLNTNIRRAEKAMKVYESIGLNNNKDFVKWALLRRLMSTDMRTWFLKHFPDSPQLLDSFAAEILINDVQNSSGILLHKMKRYPIPANLFRKMRADNKLILKHDSSFEQFVGNCAMYQLAFSLFRTNHHPFLETVVNKRMTRIVFEEFEIENMKEDK